MDRITLLKYKPGDKTEYGAANNMLAIIYSVLFCTLYCVFSFCFFFQIGSLPHANTAFVAFVFYSVIRNKLPFEDFDGDKFSTFPVSKAFPLVQ